MPPVEMIYNPLIAGLEERMSYGSLGLLECIANRMNDSVNVKKNCLLINAATVVRNCYDKSKSDAEILEAVSFDFSQIRHYFEEYVVEPSVVLVYFEPGVTKLIPEFARKKETQPRLDIDRLTVAVVKSENLDPNRLAPIGHFGNVRYYGYFSLGKFAYHDLTRIVRTSEFPKPLKAWLFSHCPIDYFFLDEYSTTEIIMSHTGKVIGKKDLPDKVFKDETIPFNKTTYKIFGDSSDFIRAACRNKPKAMKLLENTRLKLRTEREIATLAKSRLSIEPKTIDWKL